MLAVRLRARILLRISYPGYRVTVDTGQYFDQSWLTEPRKSKGQAGGGEWTSGGGGGGAGTKGEGEKPEQWVSGGKPVTMPGHSSAAPGEMAGEASTWQEMTEEDRNKAIEKKTPTTRIPKPKQPKTPKTIAVSSKDAEAYSKQVTDRLGKYGIQTDGATHVALEMQKPMLDNLEALAKDCPLDAPLMIESDKYAKKGVYALTRYNIGDPTPHRVWLNAFAFSDAKFMKDSIEYDALKQFHDGTTDPQSIITHEYMHSIANALMSGAVDPKTKIKTRDLGDTTIGATISRLVDLAQAAQFAAKSKVTSLSKLIAPSVYALESPGEFIAEAFAVGRHGTDEFKDREAVRLTADLVGGVSPLLAAIRDGKAERFTTAEKTDPQQGALSEYWEESDTWDMQPDKFRRIMEILDKMAPQVAKKDQVRYQQMMDMHRRYSEFLEEGTGAEPLE